jgi:alkanesulfonate monooxygenase SsuD/methylene tetrahydromethanopterin reductase-like flavin-dependent oxidoreductase (luciferase family)
MEDHGVAYRTRRAHAREHVMAMQALWTDEVASYEGEYVSFPPTWSWPKPATEVPVLVGGGAGPKMFAHIAEYGHGWIPIGGAGLAEAVPQLRAAFEDTGRDPATLRVVPFGSLPTHEKLDHFEAVGVTECVFRVPTTGRDTVLKVLDEQQVLVAERKGA